VEQVFREPTTSGKSASIWGSHPMVSQIVKVHVGKFKNQWLIWAMQNLVLFIKQHNAYSNNK
jgi:hypothetical protein